MRAAAVKVGIEKTHSVIGRLLRNEVYLGDEYYPQLIDEELFHKVQELRNNNARSQNRIRDYIKQAPVAENIQYRIILKDGETIDVNIDNVSDVEGAKEEIKESILAGDIKRNGVAVQMDDVADIVDIPG